MVEGDAAAEGELEPPCPNVGGEGGCVTPTPRPLDPPPPPPPPPAAALPPAIGRKEAAGTPSDKPGCSGMGNARMGCPAWPGGRMLRRKEPDEEEEEEEGAPRKLPTPPAADAADAAAAAGGVS